MNKVVSIILGGGKGTRLREAYQGPKALAPVDDQPLLWYHINPLLNSGWLRYLIGKHSCYIFPDHWMA